MSAAAVAEAAGAHERDAAGTNKWFVAVAVALGALLEIVDTSIVNVALTQMQATLGATLGQIGWVITSYGIANVIILPLSAWLGTRFGKKRYFLFSLVGFTVASMLCGLATSLPLLIAARVLQGLTGGGLLAKAQAILFETFPKSEQAMAQAFFGAIVIAGPTIGPTLGGYIVTNYDWRWIFFINLPLGVIGLAMCVAALPADKAAPDRRPVDWLSIALLAAGIGAFQTFLEEGNSEDWFASRFVIGLAVTAVVATTAFVMRTLRSAAPVVDLRVLRYRSLASGSALSVVVGMALYGTLFAVPIFAQTILGFTSQQTGMLLLPGALTSAFTMPIVGRVLSRAKDPRRVLAFGGLVLVFATLMLARLGPSSGSADLQPGLIVRAFGTVFMFLPLSLTAIGPIPKEDVAAATGFFNLTRQLGGSLGVALLTLLLDKRQAFHEAVLADKLVASDPRVVSRVELLTGAMMQKGADLEHAHGQALTILAGTIKRQAAIMAFADTFWATGVLVLVALPLIFLLGKPAKHVAVSVDH